MTLIKTLKTEWIFLRGYKSSSIMISTTAKNSIDFRVLPRRKIGDTGMSCFMINDSELLKNTLNYFDGKVNQIYIDIEQKQNINIYKTAKQIVEKSKLVTAKPNDTTVESCDLLIRNQFNDNISGKKIVVIGTGNMAAKIAIRLAERQAHVYIKGRTEEKELALVDALNLFLPRYTHFIEPFSKNEIKQELDVVVSALSGQFKEENILLPVISKHTFIIDIGINNFSNKFIKDLLKEKVKITRLDTRIAFPYQMLSSSEYTEMFFKDIYGESLIYDINVASGGFIGSEGTVIVDNMRQPNQVIGIADGSGGIKANEQLNESDKSRIQKIRQKITEFDQKNF